ncbi:ribosomal protein S18-alanine N-acetyltransferase [Microbacterium telephonicum]|uniref:Ribosomal-protein-alanine N-acetyltransferase n=1 Tax=Microbacterium telephonicum TaxID=1714841 RepID=A0A498C4D7_9MICO|nr:ribosomal protein S18-alanine N-acetyltransferase [Microbacterium telephonicum]RLK47930.1 ribosomal-protein-alanine N-acetyltransferase [Microbacterium telephonicum]
MTLRPATPADLAAIMAIEHASFPSDAWSEPMMAAELASPHNHYLVAEDGGRVVGYAGLRAPAGANDGDIQTIALADSARGRGAGRALLAALLEQAALRDVRHVFLDVRADNAVAQKLYASEGFREIGIRANYYAADGVDAIVMQLDVPAWSAARTLDQTGAC